VPWFGQASALERSIPLRDPPPFSHSPIEYFIKGNYRPEDFVRVLAGLLAGPRQMHIGFKIGKTG
jgi:hypothetical protein